MARIFMDGFETGNAYLWDGSAVAALSTVPAGMSGAYCLYCNNFMPLRTLVSSNSELYFAFKYCVDNPTYALEIMTFKDSAGTYIASLTRSAATGLLVAVRGSGGGTTLETGANTIPYNVTFLIEIRYKPLNSGGVFTVKVNGVQDINYSGDTTNGLENIKTIGIGGVSNSVYAKFDDVIVDDANWIGNTKIQAIVPTGAGATTGWTPSTGANYAAVDEIPAVNTDYVKTSSEQIDTYAMGNLTGSIASIKSVAVQTRNWREGNGLYDRGQHIVRPASTDRLAASKTSIFPITATSFQSIWELNPEDSAAWEEADVNGMEAGIKAVTA